MNVINFLTPFLLSVLSISISAMESKKLGEITEIIPQKLYVSDGLAKSGEVIYFGIEFIDEKNKEKWNVYQTQTNYKKHFYISSDALSKENRKTYFGKSGFESEEEYEKFCDNIVLNCPKLTDEEIMSLMNGYGGAIGAFTFDENDGYYVAYVSKQPINGYFDHPEDAITFKGYHEGYKNLLMCVRCKDMFNTKVYNNRGIFRGLISFLDNDHKGLAMKLHGFTASVFEKFGKTHMSVAPLRGMYQSIKKTIPQEKLITEPNIPADLDHFSGLYGMFDTKCVIDIQPLKNCFTDNK